MADIFKLAEQGEKRLIIPRYNISSDEIQQLYELYNAAECKSKVLYDIIRLSYYAGAERAIRQHSKKARTKK